MKGRGLEKGRALGGRGCESGRCVGKGDNGGKGRRSKVESGRVARHRHDSKLILGDKRSDFVQFVMYRRPSFPCLRRSSNL